MKKVAISKWDKAMLSKRYLIEAVNGQVKNIPYVESTLDIAVLRALLHIYGVV